MNNQKIKIRLKSFDYRLLAQSTTEIIAAAKRTSATVKGPIPLPTKIEKFTVNRSPHVNKKSREQFEIRTSTMLIEIGEPSAATVDALNKIALPSGVDVKINLHNTEGKAHSTEMKMQSKK